MGTTHELEIQSFNCNVELEPPGEKDPREMHTTLGLQNAVRWFHKPFQPSNDCAVIKRACPTSSPCHAPPAQKPTTLFGQLHQQTDLDKKQSSKKPSNFQRGVFLDSYDCKCCPTKWRGGRTGWTPLLVAAEPSAGQAGKETVCSEGLLQSCSHLGSICSHFWPVLVWMKPWLDLSWSHSFRYKSFLDDIWGDVGLWHL